MEKNNVKVTNIQEILKVVLVIILMAYLAASLTIGIISRVKDLNAKYPKVENATQEKVTSANLNNSILE